MQPVTLNYCFDSQTLSCANAANNSNYWHRPDSKDAHPGDYHHYHFDGFHSLACWWLATAHFLVQLLLFVLPDSSSDIDFLCNKPHTYTLKTSLIPFLCRFLTVAVVYYNSRMWRLIRRRWFSFLPYFVSSLLVPNRVGTHFWIVDSEGCLCAFFLPMMRAESLFRILVQEKNCHFQDCLAVGGKSLA